MSQPPILELYQGDLPQGRFADASVVAIDTETLGLNPYRDRLCLVQLSAGDGRAALVQLNGDYQAPELKRLLADENVLKLFHFGRFDMAVLKHYFGVMARPVYCTKIASKLARTFTDRHGLKDLCRELLGIELSKQQQSSDWGAPELDPGAAQLCRERRVASARTKRETRCHAEARGTRGACARLLRVPAREGRARSCRLVRDRSLRPLGRARCQAKGRLTPWQRLSPLGAGPLAKGLAVAM